eukprot:TRINITY_DN1631_c0_g1_i1.p1 TRINITY_DN1631_c0_g1~~TRINITY_DN1631_c0_g1_i1.p1  ORF type:complete len:369 (+),score=79.29 TRINITY_DN1631_c0_g1_i1:283-1389(+)
MGGEEKKLDLADVKAALPADGAGLTDEERAGLVSAIQDKLDTLMTQGFLATLPPAVRGRVTALQEIQKSHDDLKEKFLEEKAALEAKYQALYEPLYAQRFDIVTGAVEPPAAGEAAAAEAAAAEGGDEKGVPGFWLTAMKNNDILAEQITPRDESALKYLKDIRWSQLGDEQKGFKLEFHFDVNPYFKNTVLTKTYLMIDEEEPILEKAEGTDIEWFAGKDLTHKVLKKKPKKGAKNAKPITKTEPCESFFNFFSPPAVPTEDEELDEEEAEELQEMMEADYDVGSTLREKLIPHAVSWFTGEAADLEDMEGDEDEDDDDLDDDEDDEDEEDEDEDEDEGKPQGRKPRKKGVTAAGAAGEQPPECKQQ